MAVSVARWVRPSAAALFVASTAGAQEPSARLGDTGWALPGIERIGVPAMGAVRLSAAASAGYGYTEPLSPTDREDHRVTGTLAVGVTPTPALELGLRLDGRYDHHSDDHGNYGDTEGDPRLLARYGSRVGRDFVTGAELSAWFPGRSAPSLAFDATTLDAKWLGAWAPKGGAVIALLGGFRWDNSRHAAPDLARIRVGDRFSLELSDYDAVLAGIGASIPVGKTELLGEATWDVLVGSGAPSAGTSPIRIAAGARRALSKAFSARMIAEVSPSGRPNVGPAAPLVPIEPRFSLLIGLAYQLPFSAPESPPASSAPEPIAPAAPAEAPKASTAAIRVVAGGAPVDGATVEIHVGDRTLVALETEKGTYRAESVPSGDGSVTVHADGYEPADTAIHVEAGAPASVGVELTAVPPPGEIRGLIRSFGGRGLAASIRVQPIGAETKTDRDGAFAVRVPPGDYEVVVHAEHYKDQHRKIHVDENGVTVLNAELFEGKR